MIGRKGLIQLQREEEDQERKALLGPEASQQQQSPPTPRLEEDKQEELHQHDELEEEDASSPRERKSKQAQGVGGADLLRKPSFQVNFFLPVLSPQLASCFLSSSISGATEQNLVSLSLLKT